MVKADCKIKMSHQYDTVAEEASSTLGRFKRHEVGQSLELIHLLCSALVGLTWDTVSSFLYKSPF